MRAIADFLSSKLFHFKNNCNVQLKKVNEKINIFFLSGIYKTSMMII